MVIDLYIALAYTVGLEIYYYHLVSLYFRYFYINIFAIEFKIQISRLRNQIHLFRLLSGPYADFFIEQRQLLFYNVKGPALPLYDVVQYMEDIPALLLPQRHFCSSGKVAVYQRFID